MVNNFNPFTMNLMSLVSTANSMVEQIQNADGMNLTDEQKKEFKEKWEVSGGGEKIAQVKKAMSDLQITIKKANGTNNPPQQ